MLPDSKVRFRAGYSRNIVEGPGFSSIHEGTEQALFENYRTTINTYRIGVDLRLLPRTNFSYDQIWNHYKGDDSITDPFQNPLFKLANRSAVDLGWSFNAGANQPCGGTFLATGFVNPGCSAAFSYFNHAGPLNSKWLHPFGGLDYRFTKNWTGRAFWDYYGYHEDPSDGTVQDIFAPRNFRGNLVTLSVRYAF